MTKRTIIFTSHGTYAQGIFSTLKCFSGVIENVTYLCLEEKSLEQFRVEIQQILEKSLGEVVVFTDLFNGTPFKEFFTVLYQRKDAYIISNASFAHALTAITVQNQPIEEFLAAIESEGKLAIKKMDAPLFSAKTEDE